MSQTDPSPTVSRTTVMAWLGLSMVVAACAGDRDKENLEASGGWSDGSGASTNPSGNVDTGESSNDPSGVSSAEDGGKFDLSADGDGSVGMGDDGMMREGCEKVDFLFVVDSSSSMNGEQTNLINSFPKFIDTIQVEVAAQDYHLMVVDTDALDACEDICANPMYSGCESVNGTVSCHTYADYDMCDRTLGAGRIRTWDNTVCPIDNGRRYMLETESDLKETFECAARVGTVGHRTEHQAGAAIAALDGALVGPGGCNEGFLREDALLVITIITDEDDGPEGSGGNRAAWKQALVDVKQGEERHVVVLALVGDGGASSGGICLPYDGKGEGAIDARELRSFAESFAYGYWGSVCTDNYDPFFEQAAAAIATACDDFVPPE